MGFSVPPIPDSLRENLAYELGEAEAERWLEHAVEHAHGLIADWELIPDQVLAGGSESLCIKCDGPDGAPLVLKLPASITSGAAEIGALRAWAGDGAACVLREEPSLSATLMNFLGWVGEGTFTVAQVIELAGRLHGADTGGFKFPSVDDNIARRVAWAADRFAEPGHETHRADLDVAEKLLAAERSVDEPQVLLHGDLQAKNLIVSDDGLAVVDPMPCLGPAIFDLAFWVVKCPDHHPMTECLDQVTRLRPDLDPDRLLRWCWALAVVESRPYLGHANLRRQEFIEMFREGL